MEIPDSFLFIKQVELFNHLNDKELYAVSNHLQWQVIEPNTLLVRAGDAVVSLFFVAEGELKLVKLTNSGEEKRLSFLGKYDFLGESALLETGNSVHALSAVAAERTLVFSLKKAVLEHLFANQPSLAVKIVTNIAGLISRRLRPANQEVAGIAAHYKVFTTRTEHDLLGYKEVANDCYYGIQTQRALENFAISSVPLYKFPELAESLAMVKLAATKANLELGILEETTGRAIITACQEIIKGKHHAHFVVDLIQGGAGTSTNMNANEVIANRALELLGYKRGEYTYCHPNNHVNLSQSTNDVYPTAIKIALIYSNEKLLQVLSKLITAFRKKGKEFAHIIKMGRTQLQDAVPTTLGLSFEAYAVTLEEEIDRLKQNARLFLEVNMGATAIGTSINTDPGYRDKVIAHLRQACGLEVVLAENLIEATQDTGAFVMYSSAVKRLAVKLSKIANDLRLLSSGPRAGIGEINLPPMQPGSSIMPGKVNPVIPEVVNQIAFKVIGNDLTVTFAAEASQLELNVMEPIMVQSIFESIQLLNNGINTFTHKCVNGITANEKHCREMVENSIGLVTALNPVLGYETCSALAKEALETNRSVYGLVLEKNLLSKVDLDELLLPENMISPHRHQLKYV